MGAVTQCDSCRKIGPAPPCGWLVLFRYEPQPSMVLAALTGGPEPSGTFCSWACVAEYAAVRALVPSSEDGETP